MILSILDKMKTTTWRVYKTEDYKPEYTIENSGRDLLVRDMIVRNVNGRAEPENGDEPGRLGWAVRDGYSGAIYQEVSTPLLTELHKAQKTSTSFDDFIQRMEESVLIKKR